jgi:hypothetical protein
MTPPRPPSTFRFLRRPTRVALLALAVLGCQNRGDLSGTVTHQDRPLVYGTVLVVASDGNAHQGPIEEDGRYTVRGVLAGPARLAINSPDPGTPLVSRDDNCRDADDLEMQRRAALRAKWFAIPGKYGDPGTSELSVEVRKGENKHDIRLK